MGSAVFTRWNFSGPWSVAVRPESYWDPNGTLTGSIQFIKAITATVEYKLTEGEMNGRLRLEYRYDNSTGAQGGFYGAAGVNGPLVSVSRPSSWRSYSPPIIDAGHAHKKDQAVFRKITGDYFRVCTDVH